MGAGAVEGISGYISDRAKEQVVCQADPECAADIERERKDIQATFAKWVPSVGR